MCMTLTHPHNSFSCNVLVTKADHFGAIQQKEWVIQVSYNTHRAKFTLLPTLDNGLGNSGYCFIIYLCADNCAGQCHCWAVWVYELTYWWPYWLYKSLSRGKKLASQCKLKMSVGELSQCKLKMSVGELRWSASNAIITLRTDSKKEKKRKRKEKEKEKKEKNLLWRVLWRCDS